MNNLTQTQQDAKQAYLSKQLEQTIVRYENADTNERKAVIRHIDSFIPNEPKESKIFWLKLRYRLERMNELNSQKIAK